MCRVLAVLYTEAGHATAASERRITLCRELCEGLEQLDRNGIFQDRGRARSGVVIVSVQGY